MGVGEPYRRRREEVEEEEEEGEVPFTFHSCRY